MNPSFAYLLICVLLPRIVYQWTDERLGLKAQLRMLVFEVILLLPLVSLNSIVPLAILLLIYHVLLYATEKEPMDLYVGRILQFMTVWAVIATISVFLKLRPAAFVDQILDTISNEMIFLQAFDMGDVWIQLFGAMFLISEVNNIIRFVLNKIRTFPEDQKQEENEIDSKEFNKGRIIGVLERVLFFFFVLTGNISSIGFILTAKGIVRFKNLETRDFAEYVLIGTLLSASLAIFWGYLIKQLI
jgi:hypothetical protein